ncbi:hypothetical protein Tco_0544529, partial [Tanacetum coccineum]
MEPRHRLLLMGPCQIAAELELQPELNEFWLLGHERKFDRG